MGRRHCSRDDDGLEFKSCMELLPDPLVFLLLCDYWGEWLVHFGFLGSVEDFQIVIL